jgi:DNA-binding NtrC family response regulator
MAALTQSDWPGNVREFQNYIERVMAMNPGKVLYPTPPPRDLEVRQDKAPVSRSRRLADQVSELERRAIKEALERAQGNQSVAAKFLGMREQTLRYRLRKYGSPPSRKNRRIRKSSR